MTIPRPPSRLPRLRPPTRLPRPRTIRHHLRRRRRHHHRRRRRRHRTLHRRRHPPAVAAAARTRGARHPSAVLRAPAVPGRLQARDGLQVPDDPRPLHPLLTARPLLNRRHLPPPRRRLQRVRLRRTARRRAPQTRPGRLVQLGTRAAAGERLDVGPPLGHPPRRPRRRRRRRHPRRRPEITGAHNRRRRRRSGLLRLRGRCARRARRV